MLRMKAILLGVALVVVNGAVRAQSTSEQKPAKKQVGATSKAANGPTGGKDLYLQYCASCHGEDGKGNGPAAFAMKTPPPDLTTLSQRHEGKYPAGYVRAVLQFGRSFAAHGSEDMPVWGTRFKKLDPVRDPTGQKHVDAVVAFLRSEQGK